MEIPFFGGSVQGRSSNVSPETLINMFYEKAEGGEYYAPVEGATEFADLTAGEIRGCIDFDSKAWFVRGDTLYELDSAGTSVSRGTLLTSSGRVSMAHNGTRITGNQQIMIVDGTYGYIYDNNTQITTQITDVDFTASQSIVFMDGYFIFSQIRTDRFWLTALYDGAVVDAADFSTAEGHPDIIQALIADRRELYIFGKESLEIWYNAGDTDNTFQRFQGGFTQSGCAAPFSPANFDNSVIWLTQNSRGQGLIAILGDAYQPKIISPPELNYEISTYSKIDDAYGFAYQIEGNEFYSITFPTAKRTHVYNAATAKWHIEGHVIDGVWPNQVRYNCHLFSMGKHLFGDITNGKIYEMGGGTLAGARIPRERTTANFTVEEERIRIANVQLDMEEGVGDPNDTTDDKVWFSYSKDGGHTFSNEISRDTGDLGDYKKRLIWRRLGHGRNWCFRWRTWSPNKPVFKGAYAKLYNEQAMKRG